MEWAWWDGALPTVGMKADMTFGPDSAIGLAMRGNNENDLYLLKSTRTARGAF
jgi:hypothetical protein